jgi:hypothetical protein
MNTSRDFNAETKDTPERLYAYSFDFDVMHPFMIRSFEPFFKPGSLLELGSFQGDFTTRLLSHLRTLPASKPLVMHLKPPETGSVAE